MTATRGSWTIEEGVVAQWRAEGLDEVFRAYWPDPTDTTYTPLNHDMAEPEPPGPYAVYRLSGGVVVGHMTGLSLQTERQLLDYTVTIEIHAKSDDTTSGKAIARELAKQVIAAFDPAKPLPICDDQWVQTRRGPDEAIRLGDAEWAWSCFFTIQIDAVYDRA